MSKNGGNCSVNLKKNIKNFFKPLQCRVCPFRYHLYHHAQTVDLQGFSSILRCYDNEFPCFTLDKPLWRKGLRCFSLKFHEMRKISTEVRGLCCDYAGNFVENVSQLVLRITPTLYMSASSAHLYVVIANPLYDAISYITLLYVIACASC